MEVPSVPFYSRLIVCKFIIMGVSAINLIGKIQWL